LRITAAKKWLAERPVLRRLTLPATALACALLWGSAFPAIKTAYRLMGDPGMGERLAFAGVRFALAGAVLLAFTPDRRKQFRSAPKLTLFAAAATQVALNYFFFYWSISLIDGVLGAILNATGSFWWVLFAPLLDRRESVRPIQWLCVLMGFAGVFVCVWRPDGLDQAPWLGVVLMLMGTMSGAMAMFFVRPLNKRVSIRFITGFALFAGGSALALAGAPSLPALFGQATWPLVGLTLHLAMVSAVAFSLWYWLVTLYDFPTLSGYRFLVPICGALESALLIPNESITLQIALGGAITLSSVWLLERLRAK